MPAIHFNAGICTACCACTMACMDENDTDLSVSPPLRSVLQAETLTSNGVRFEFFSEACHHCASPACVSACPMGCFHRDDVLNLVLLNALNCIGCHHCVKVCPYNAIRIRVDGTVDKCNGCAERQAAGLEPACVVACPTGALTLGKAAE